MYYSLLESNRFNLRVFRAGVMPLSDALGLRQYLLDNDADVFIFRVPVETQRDLYRLYELGFNFLVADTLVYYSHDVRTPTDYTLRNQDLVIEAANQTHFETINELAGIIFEDYASHYAANPYLTKMHILAGYQEWATSYLSASDATKATFLVSRAGQYVGFATVSFTGGTGEIILNGVMPASRNQGIYGDLVRYIRKSAHERGCQKLQISTQVQNYAVQKVWVREGFYLTHAYLTIHINCLLGRSKQIARTSQNDTF